MPATVAVTSVSDRLFDFAKKHGIASVSEIRQSLSLKSFNEFKVLMTEGKDELIFEPFGTMYTEFGLNVYAHPPYPGTGPILIASYSGLVLPEELQTEVKRRSLAGCILDDAFRELSPFSHNPKNEKCLAQYKLETAHEMSHYDY